MLDQLPQLTALDDLAVLDIDSTPLSRLESFPHISRLALSGSYAALAQIDQSRFQHLSHLSLEVSGSLPLVQPRALSQTFFTADLPYKALSLLFTDASTNASISQAICGATSVTNLRMLGSERMTKWWRVPSCISSWSGLTDLMIERGQLPNFTALPVGLNSVSLGNNYGTWN